MHKMGSMISGIILLSIGVIVLANVFISTVKGTNTSTWTTGERETSEDFSALSSSMGNFDNCERGSFASGCPSGLWACIGTPPALKRTEA